MKIKIDRNHRKHNKPTTQKWTVSTQSTLNFNTITLDTTNNRRAKTKEKRKPRYKSEAQKSTQKKMEDKRVTTGESQFNEEELGKPTPQQKTKNEDGDIIEG